MRHKKAALAILAMALGLLWPLSAALAQGAPNCPLVRYASLDMWTEPDGRVDAPLTLEGHEYRFLVDTGGAISTIDPSYAFYRMKMPAYLSSNGIAVVGGAKVYRYAAPQSVSFGGVSVREAKFYLNPPGWRVAGTIAPDLLQKFDLDFDFAKGRLNLFSPDHCAGAVPAWTTDPIAVVPILPLDESNHIRIEIQVDGKTVQAVVDTGA